MNTPKSAQAPWDFAELKAAKSALRKELLKIRDSMTCMERERGDLLITDRIIGHQWFYGAEVLLAFVNYGSEIDTHEIINEALRKQKEVFVPKIEGNNMEFYQITSMTQLREGYKGIQEPTGDSKRFCYEEYQKKRILLLMPGVAFDLYGNRMGYGKGFYDRFLEDKELLQTYSIGIGYCCQRVEQLPVDEHDKKPYQVILV